MLGHYANRGIIIPADPTPQPLKTDMPSSDADKIIAQRIADKKASRKKDLALLEAGYSPEKLQRENSIFPAGFFKKGKISNFAEAVGR